jgi:PHP family Zn ribbon phosphoesterase
MDEFINRKSLKERFRNINVIGRDGIVQRIEEEPTADVVEVRRGEWEHFTELEVKQTSGKIPIPKKYLHGQCSNCNHCFIMLNKKHFSYCPNCGAKMDGKGEGE